MQQLPKPPPPQLLDDSAAFTIARAVKLGDSDGDYGTAPTVSATKKTNLKKNDCKTDSDCPSSQKCTAGKCEDVCTSSTCSGETPDCSADNHKSVCKCTENSCGSGKKCADGQCVPCSVGDKCGCSGAQVIVSGGKCGCSASTTCPAGQYKTDDCSCRNCLKDDTYNRCGCAAPLVPNGSGSCYCKETTCAAGNSFSTSKCGCVPCTDNASCQYPCENGTPNGSGGCDTSEPLQSCSQMGYSTYCEAGYSSSSAGVSGSEGACVICTPISGYCTSDSDCSNSQYCFNNICTTVPCDTSNGYTISNHACVATACPSGYSTSATSCSGGYTLDIDGKSGGKSCGKCVKTGCTSDSDCGNSQYCSNYTCTKVSCGACQTANNHTCVAVSGCCTSDSQCSSNQKCSGNKCVAVSCGACQTASNHTCVAVSGCCTSDSQCSSNQKCSGNKCVAVSCGACYEASNHACVKKTGCCTSDSDCSGGQKCNTSSNACYTPATKTCSDYGYKTYTSAGNPCPSGQRPKDVYPVTGLRCAECVSTGNSCTKGSPSSSGRKFQGTRFCYFTSSAARNAWLNSGCASHLICSTVTNYTGNVSGCQNWVEITAEGYLGGTGKTC